MQQELSLGVKRQSPNALSKHHLHLDELDLEEGPDYMSLKIADRYAKPTALAADLERCLADEPVTVLAERMSDRLARVEQGARTLMFLHQGTIEQHQVLARKIEAQELIGGGLSLLAVAMGADAVGFVFAASPRQVAAQRVYDITRRLPPEILTVGVFRDEHPDRVIDIVDRSGVKAAQLHGRETPEAIATAGATASRAVLFSGSAFVLAMVGLLLVQSTIMRSLAVGAIVAAGGQYGRLSTILGFAAVICAATNVVAGFLITDRMLAMFKGQKQEGSHKKQEGGA